MIIESESYSITLNKHEYTMLQNVLYYAINNQKLETIGEQDLTTFAKNTWEQMVKNNK